MGTKVWAMMEGNDGNEPLQSEHIRKTYSAEVNWGVRFEVGEEHLVKRFIFDIAAVVCEELGELGLAAKTVGITLKKRKTSAGAPYKMLGHGEII